MLPIHSILLPTDFSGRSACAFQLACLLARESGAKLVVLHVVEPPPFITHGEMGKALEQAQGYRRELTERLHNLQSDDPNLSIEYCLEDGEPVREILSAAEKHRSDLIVMGTHGRTGFRRLLMGSVAEQVLRRASCPVLTVNTPLELAAREMATTGYDSSRAASR
jgi:nucleotide-binding universal stress UspA family protein